MTSTPDPASGVSPGVTRDVTEAGVTHPVNVFVTQDLWGLDVS